jgi:hypothetical protein
MRGATLPLLLGTLACGPGDHEGSPEAPVVEAGYGQRFDLGLGERADVDGFRVVFTRIAEDSRCPEGAECVQAGNAAAAFSVGSEEGSATLTLHTDREPRRAAAMGRALRLIELRPRPVAEVRPDTVGYVATLLVEPAP